MEISDVKELLDRYHIPQRELAEFMGVNLDSVNRLINGKRKRVSQEEIVKIERFFKFKTETDISEDSYRAAVDSNSHMSAGGDEVPLFTSIETSAGLRLSLSPVARTGTASKHPAQRGSALPFAVVVSDNSMSPRYEIGEIVYAVSRRQPRAGEDCLVETRQKMAYLLRYLGDTNDGVPEFREIKTGRLRTFGANEGVLIHAVVGRG